MPQAFEFATVSGKTPALTFLREHGSYQPECVTAFPTMTASVDATLMTGVYPDQHKIPGLIWYDPKAKKLIDYVNGTKTVLKLGIQNIAENVLIHLNQHHLNRKVKTIFEELADKGKTSGSINFIIHRGRTKYRLKPPLLLNLVTKFSFYNQEISGPELLSIGSFFKPEFPGRRIRWGWNQTIFQHFGVNDYYAAQVTKMAIASGKQPDLMLIYLPDHDHYLHKHINQPLESLMKVDKKIGEILDLFGSWEEAIRQNTFIIIGDHGQTEIGKSQDFNIDLDQLLQHFSIAKVGKKVREQDDLILANNERMVYIYPFKENKQKEIIKALLTEERIDFIAWKEGKYAVVKNHRGLSMRFSKGGDFVDEYGEKWNIKGDFHLLDVKKDNKKLSFHEYPDALSRLYGAIFSQEIFAIVATAKPSYEFKSKTFPMHLGGGSHGSLHRIDSVVPLLVSGATVDPHPNTRLVDLKDYILQLLNVTSVTTG